MLAIGVHVSPFVYVLSSTILEVLNIFYCPHHQYEIKQSRPALNLVSDEQTRGNPLVNPTCRRLIRAPV